MSEPAGKLTVSLERQPGRPVLVLGPSLGTARSVWDPQAPALSGEFSLLRYDLPGHDGRSWWEVPVTVAGLGAAVLERLDHWGIERIAYCGISLGGMVGLWLAAHAPDRVTSLAVVCSSAYLPPADGWRARADLVLRDGMAAVVPASVRRWFTPEFAERHPALVASFMADLAGTVPRGYAGCCLAIADMDLRDSLRLIRAPALVVSGARDPATPPEHGAAIAAGIAGAEHLVLPDAAHLANVSSPDEVTAALLGHLSKG